MKQIAMACVAVFFAGQALGAEVGFYDVAITRIINDSEYYGGCLVKTVPGPETVAPTCDSTYLTFSCTGDYNTKSEGKSKYDTALAAMALQQGVYLLIDDTKKHNGYCWARRVDLLNTDKSVHFP